MPTRRLRGVDSARRALQILLEFSKDTPEMRVEDLPRRYGISLASAYRYISLLREMNLIEERDKGTFVLSLRVLKLTHAAEQTLNYQRDIQPFLNHLTNEISETSLYLRRVNNSVVCVAIAKTSHALNISFEPGHIMPLHRGAGAKILLSNYTVPEQKQYLKRFPHVFTKANTSKFLKELEKIRVDDFAESYGEVDTGVWACAAPVFFESRMMGVISVVTPDYRMCAETRKYIAERVRTTVSAIEDNLELNVSETNVLYQK